MKTKIIFLFCLLLIANCQLTLQAQTWHAIGNGIGNFGLVDCMKVLKNILYVGGSININYGAPGNGIISFDGENWDSLACGPDGGVYSIDTFTDGMIYISGGFVDLCGDYSYRYIAKWNGSFWEHFTGTLPDNSIRVMKFKDQLYFGGNFYKVGSMIVNRVASWDGSNWHDLDGGVLWSMGASVWDMAVYKGKLIVAGAFTQAGSVNANYIAAWDGTAWDSLGGGLDNGVTCLYVDSVNDLLCVGGGFTKADTVSVHGVAVWDGTKWSAPGQCIVPAPLSLCVFNNKLYVGGQATSYPGSDQDTVLAYWDGIQWTKISGPNCNVEALSVYKGNLYVGGSFNQINGDTSIKYIACYGDSCPENVGIHEIKTDKTEYLWQNIPNPFDNTTSIPYYIPYGSKGFLQITDTKGELVDEYTLQQGKNILSASLDYLKSGTYFYTIFIDGTKKDSKKMILK